VTVDSAPESRTIQVGSQPVFYIYSAPPGGSHGLPVILVHGVSGTTDWWTKNWAALAAHVDVYALDLPGFGRSPLAGRFSVDDQIALVQAWMSAVGVTRAILIGHSMGGYIVASVAIRAPERVAALVLVDAAIFAPGRGWLRLVLGLLPAPLFVSLDFWPTLIRGFFAAGLWTVLRAARDLLAKPILQQTSAIRAPTLLLWGRRDTLVPRSVAQGVKAALAHRATGPVFLKGGHVAMWSDPHRFNGEVLAFIRNAARSEPEAEG